jgi:hypothetical protein
VAGLGVLVFASACSVLVQPNREQCVTDTDCTRRGGAFAGSVCSGSVCRSASPAPTPTDTPTAWGCLGQSVWPDAGVGTVNVTIGLRDLITYQPVAGVGARLCRKLDTKCEQPILDGVQSDASGTLAFQAPLGFDGYVELNPDGAIPGLYFFYPPLTEPRDVPFIPILPLSELSTFAQLVGGEITPGRGQLVVGAYNCLQIPAEGVTLSSAEADAASMPFYLIKGVPSSKATATDSSGYGGIINLLPGTATLTGKIGNGESLGIESVLMRADEITYTTLLPLPG